MPTRSKSNRLDIDIGTVRIPATDLITRLEKISDSSLEIKASNDGLVFHDLKDIKDHPELFSGEPTLNIDEITIHFGKFGTNVTIWNTKDVDNSVVDLANNLVEFLKNYQSKLFDFFINKYWLSIFICPAIYILPEPSNNQNYWAFVTLGILTAFLCSAFFCVYYFYQKPVSHFVRETFW